MKDLSPYHDSRREFFYNFFEKGLAFDDYVASGTSSQQDKWQQFNQLITLNDKQKSTLQAFVRKMNILVMSGIWCGDCARQGPMLNKIAQASRNLNIRYIESKEHPRLQEELRLNGATKVPVVVFLSEDFFELGRFGDRTLSVYRKKLVNELGAACDPGILPPSNEELCVETNEWLNEIERLHAMLRLAPMLRKRYED